MKERENTMLNSSRDYIYERRAKALNFYSNPVLIIFSKLNKADLVAAIFPHQMLKHLTEP